MIFDNVKSIVIPEGSVKEITCNNVTLWQKIRTIIETVSGVGTIVLQKVIRLVGITQYGKCEQASTPTPSVPVDIKCNNGAVKVGREIYTTPLGRTVYGGTLDVTSGVLTVDRAMVDLGTLNYGLNNHATLGQYFWCDVYGRNIKRTGDYGTTVYPSICSAFKCVPRNTREFVNSTYCFDGSADRVTQIQFKDSAYSDATSFKTAVSGVQLVYELAAPQTYQLAPHTVEMIAERSMFQSDAGSIDITYYANGTLKTVSGNPVVIADADGRNAEDVIVHIEPIQSGSGTPSPTNIRPISGMTDINITRLGGVVVDGTPEVLTVTGKNLFDISAYDDASDWTGTPYKYIAIPLQNGQYTISWDKSKGGGFYWLVQVDGAVKGTSTAGRGGSWLWHDTNTSLQKETITFTVTEGYVYFTCSFGGYFAQKFLPALETVQIEKGSTATAYEPYFAQTASDIPMLLSVGNYKDEGELISGLLTHKCGVKVLTSANIATFSNGCFFVNIDDKKEGKETILSTHFTYVAGASSTIAVGEMGASGGTSKSTFYKVGGVMSKAEAGAWVDGQYANGTPVIVVYPLAQSTEESVTPQSFTTSETVTISAESDYVDNIALSGAYETPEP